MSGNKKRIAVISAYNYNYGTILQASALVNILNKSESKIEVIKYKKNISFMQVKRIINFTLVKAKLLDCYKKFKMSTEKKRRMWIKEKNRKFSEFIYGTIPFSEEVVGYKNLKRKILEYDSVLLGSDQLWNPINIGTRYFTLEFVPNYIPKYTYATSFGVTILNRNQRKIMAKCISRIDTVSVREQQGALLVNELISNKKVRVDLDPTLLIDSVGWEEIIFPKKLIEDRYVFAYFVGNNREYREIVDEFARKNNYKVILLPHTDQYVGYEYKYENEISMTAGPKDFVNLIRFADYVFTDSFHGCVFSILNKKAFFVFERFNNSDIRSMNSRIESLFTILDVPNRWIKSLSDVENKIKDINYEEIDRKLKIHRDNSLSYLNNLFN